MATKCKKKKNYIKRKITKKKNYIKRKITKKKNNKKKIKKYKMNKRRLTNNKKTISKLILDFIYDIFNFLRIGQGYRILKRFVEPLPKILTGDIIIYENFGGPPFLRIQHSSIATRDGEYFTQDGKFYINIYEASCGGKLCKNYYKTYEVDPINSNKYLWIIRYTGYNAERLRNIAANKAVGWGNTRRVKYKKIHQLPSAFARAKFFPCYSSEADKKSIEIYTKNNGYGSIPVNRKGENVNMICSKFVMGAWMAAIGSGVDGTEQLNKCLPVKPSNCSPGDTLKLGLKPCWDVIGRINVGYL
tara:strand:- start:340 stop:1245 length:906 start_codon:yes stop_codon:yes gene_type:complete